QGRISSMGPPSHCAQPTIYRERATYHETRGWTAEPEDSTCNLLRPAEPTDGNVFQHLIKGVCLCGHHLVQHRSIDDAWAYGIDENASCGVVECRAFGEPKYAMLRGLVCSSFATGHQSSARRAVYDGAAPLREHLPQFALHATPHAAKIDRNHAVKVFSRSIGGFYGTFWTPALLQAASSLPNIATVRSTKLST